MCHVYRSLVKFKSLIINNWCKETYVHTLTFKRHPRIDLLLCSKIAWAHENKPPTASTN